MRIDRLAVLGALALILSSAGCTGSTTTTTAPPVVPTPVPAPQLLRFVQGGPSSGSGGSGTVDVCIDTQPFGGSSATAAVNYGSITALYLVDTPKLVSVYNGIGAGAGAECATAPAAYLGNAPIATAAIPAGTNVRRTIVLGGTSASGTLGLYLYNEPTYAVTPAGFVAITHNVAPVFSTGKANGVGFGICTSTVTPCTTPVAIVGAQARAVGVPSTASAGVLNSPVISALSSVPPGFYDGIGVAAGTPVPITSIASPSPLAFQAYIVLLYSVDAPAGGLNLLAVVETSTGFGF